MSGEKAAVEAVGTALSEIEDEEAEQLDLLGLPAPTTEQGQAKVAHVKRGPGRPLGSKNKRTERTVAWLMQKYRDPREQLLAVAQMHPADLAVLLSCTMKEALEEIRLCAATVLPFVAQKQPLAVDVSNKSVVYLNIHEQAPADGNDGGFGLAAAIVESVQYIDMEAPPIEDLSDAVG